VQILQILSVIVMIRVGNATGMTLLKGAGSHRVVSATNIITAVCNVALSIALVRPLGLLGVALGTLAPVAIASVFVLFPLACRRVELSVATAVGRGVWPAVWPGLAMAAFILATRPLVAPTLLAVAAECAAAGLVYAITFLLFSLNAIERQFYVGKLGQMLHITRLRPAEETL
jgi:O-antigen/teichoic acid export membrane protein